jgi:hypothetical protein
MLAHCQRRKGQIQERRPPWKARDFATGDIFRSRRPGESPLRKIPSQLLQRRDTDAEEFPDAVVVYAPLHTGVPADIALEDDNAGADNGVADEAGIVLEKVCSFRETIVLWRTFTTLGMRCLHLRNPVL